jgi:hypothetical protein
LLSCRAELCCVLHPSPAQQRHTLRARARLVADGLLTPQPDVAVPEIPMDLATAVKLKKVILTVLLCYFLIVAFTCYSSVRGVCVWGGGVSLRELSPAAAAAAVCVVCTHRCANPPTWSAPSVTTGARSQPTLVSCGWPVGAAVSCALFSPCSIPTGTSFHASTLTAPPHGCMLTPVTMSPLTPHPNQV